MKKKGTERVVSTMEELLELAKADSLKKCLIRDITFDVTRGNASKEISECIFERCEFTETFFIHQPLVVKNCTFTDCKFKNIVIDESVRLEGCYINECDIYSLVGNSPEGTEIVNTKVLKTNFCSCYLAEHPLYIKSSRFDICFFKDIETKISGLLIEGSGLRECVFERVKANKCQITHSYVSKCRVDAVLGNIGYSTISYTAIEETNFFYAHEKLESVDFVKCNLVKCSWSVGATDEVWLRFQDQTLCARCEFSCLGDVPTWSVVEVSVSDKSTLQNCSFNRLTVKLNVFSAICENVTFSESVVEALRFDSSEIRGEIKGIREDPSPLPFPTGWLVKVANADFFDSGFNATITGLDFKEITVTNCFCFDSCFFGVKTAPVEDAFELIEERSEDFDFVRKRIS